ncbi:MAG: Na+/H+ antiporter subunit E [Clostridia bacterium]|nr:Na+/H+ antiporter subunit E [Clostridia bacterium]
MIILLFIFWIILNGRLSLDWGMLQIVLTGIALVAVVGFFANRAFGYKPSTELRLWKKAPLLICYAALLLKEIIKASFKMISIILSKGKKYEPAIIKFEAPLKTNFARVILANSITLTPGTITADLTDDYFIVHCIDISLADGIEQCDFVKLLERIEK